MEQRRFAAAGRAHHRGELTGSELEIHPIERNDGLRPFVDLAHGPARNRGRGGEIFQRHGVGEYRIHSAAVISPLRRAWRQRALIVALTRRELQARYRNGVLGYFWSLANPLLLLLVYATVFRLVFKPRADVHPYALFLFAGVLTWGFVSAAILDAAETFRVNGPLLRKTTVAPEVFPAVAVAARLSHLLLALPVLAAAILVACYLGAIRPSLEALAFPAVIFLLTLAVFGIALAVSSLAVHFGDVRDLVANLLTLAFFLTPILYPMDSVPDRFRPWLRANPFATFFAAIHDSAFFFRPIPAVDWLWMAGTALVCLGVGAAIFERLRDSIAEED
jgi:lipopolysaccharide transport system permease protein